MPIQKEVTFNASPARIYQLLSQSDQFAAATGRSASIGPEGETFSLFGGFITGRNIELVPGRRVVQAWRSQDWGPGVYSLVRFTLTGGDGGTRMVVTHDAYPEGASPMYPTWHQHLSENWPAFYFNPFRRYLAA